MGSTSEAGHRTAPLRPLGVGETLDTAIKLYRADALELWRAIAVVVVPLALIELTVRRAVLPSDVFVHDGSLYTHTGSGTTGGGLVALLILALLGVLANLLATGAVFKLLLDGYLGRRPDWRASLAFARHKVGSLLLLGIVAAIAITIGFVLIILPGIWLAVSFSVAVPVLLLEELTGLGALGRSRRLVSGRWWATFARLLAGLLLFGVLSFLISALAGSVSSALSITDPTLFVVVNVVLSTIATILTTPLLAALVTVVYVDLRVRKEALDLEILAAAGSGPPSFGA